MHHHCITCDQLKHHTHFYASRLNRTVKHCRDCTRESVRVRKRAMTDVERITFRLRQNFYFQQEHELAKCVTPTMVLALLDKCDMQATQVKTVTPKQRCKGQYDLIVVPFERKPPPGKSINI
jgi:hypothetical protein